MFIHTCVQSRHGLLLPLWFLPYVLKQGLLLYLDLLDGLARDSYLSLPPQYYITDIYYHVKILHGSWASSCFCVFTQQGLYQLSRIPNPVCFWKQEYVQMLRDNICACIIGDNIEKWINLSSTFTTSQFQCNNFPYETPASMQARH